MQQVFSVAAYAGKSVLITGGLGFIGSNLAIALAEGGAKVTIVDAMRPEYGGSLANIEPVRDRVAVNLSDLRDQITLQHLLVGQEFVFNLAGQVSHLRSMQDPIGDLEINCRAQLALLECCRRSCPDAVLILASTRQVYGRPQRTPVDETHPTIPVDINGVHKLATEHYYQLYYRVHRLRTVTLRLTNTYGPRLDLVNADKGVIGVFIAQALAGQTLQLYGEGSQQRDFNYVDDVVEALLRTGQCNRAIGETFNLGHAQPYSLRQLANMLCELVGCQSCHVPFPPDQAAIEIGDYNGDFSKLTRFTGWQPQIDLQEGLRRTVTYFRSRSEINPA